jgi:hypothetical protein
MSDWECATEEELLQRLSDDIRLSTIVVHPSDASFYAKIKAKYPTHTFGIKWNELPFHRSFGAQPGRSPDQKTILLQGALRQFAEDAKISPNENVYVIGDGVLTVALEMPFSVLLTHAVPIFIMPQHTYLLKQDYSWCFRYSFEGHIDYGQAAQSS